MKILLIGKDGQLGRELIRSLAPLGQITALGRRELDLSDIDAVRSLIRARRPELIVNAAAYTAVDKAEEELDLAFAINSLAPLAMAEEAARLRAGLVHYSTDYVFDGTKQTPYVESDLPRPTNVYGASKLAGEQAIAGSEAPHFVFRTSWVYGACGKNFFLTMLRLAAQQTEIKVVEDQIGAPTWSKSIAEATARVLQSCFHNARFGRQKGLARMYEHRGLYNMTARGSTSWCGFARCILRELAPDVAVVGIASSEYRTAARRPTYSVLDCEKLAATFGIALPHWDEALQQMIAEREFPALAPPSVKSGTH